MSEKFKKHQKLCSMYEALWKWQCMENLFMIYNVWWKELTEIGFFLINDLIIKSHDQLHGGLCPANVDFSSFFTLSPSLLAFSELLFPFHFSCYFCLFSIFFIIQRIMWFTVFFVFLESHPCTLDLSSL